MVVSDDCEKSLVVIHLTGGNDYLNTVILCNNELYYYSRPPVHHSQDDVIKLDDELGLNPRMGTVKRL